MQSSEVRDSEVQSEKKNLLNTKNAEKTKKGFIIKLRREEKNQEQTAILLPEQKADLTMRQHARPRREFSIKNKPPLELNSDLQIQNPS